MKEFLDWINSKLKTSRFLFSDNGEEQAIFQKIRAMSMQNGEILLSPEDWEILERYMDRIQVMKNSQGKYIIDGSEVGQMEDVE